LEQSWKHRRRSAIPSVAPLTQQHLSLLSQEHGYSAYWRVRRPLESHYEVFHRTAHQPAHLVRVDRSRCLCGEAEAVTEIVDRQREWIVGTLLCPQQLDARREQLRLGRRFDDMIGIAIIQQGSEQRGSRGDGTAALGK